MHNILSIFAIRNMVTNIIMENIIFSSTIVKDNPYNIIPKYSINLLHLEKNVHLLGRDIIELCHICQVTKLHVLYDLDRIVVFCPLIFNYQVYFSSLGFRIN